MNDVLKIVNKIIDIEQNLHGEEYLKKLISNISEYLDVKYVFIGHPLCENLEQLQTDIVWRRGEFLDNFVYDLKDTPCEVVISGKRVCIHASDVIKKFPKDELLAQMEIEAYLGAPVIDSKNNVSFLLVILDDKPIKDVDSFQSITEFLANRVSTEIQKYKIEENLIALVTQRTKELEKAQREIELINKELEQRVQEEIEKNMQKERIILEQSKMVLMGEMIDNIAHQFKQPLSLITTNASGVKLQKELGTFNEESLIPSMNLITESGRYLANTIDDFRNFFNPSKNIVSFNIKKTFEKTFRLMASEFKTNKIEIIYEALDIEVRGLENELLQVLINILKNAKDQLMKINDNERALLFINTYIEGEDIIIKIKDNANGIPLDIIKKVFDYRFTTKNYNEGSGIGLFMCKQIIENNIEGKLDVSNVEYEYENKKYKGAEFNITIKSKR